MSKYGDFWFDEIFSFTYSQKPWLDSFKYWVWETNPPLHMVFLKFWLYIFPANEFWTRMPSLIFGVLTVFFLYKLAFRIFNKQTALIAAALLALHPYHIFHSVTARGYSLLMMLAVLSIYLFYKVFLTREPSSSLKNVILFAIVNLLLIFTHLTAWAIIVTQLIILIIDQRDKIKSWLKINAVPLFIYLLWFIPSILSKLGQKQIGNAWFLNLTYDFESIIKNIRLIFIGPINYLVGAVLILISIISVFLIIKRQNQQNKVDKNFLFLIFLFLFPFMAISFLGIWNVRFFVISTPWLVLIIAYLLFNLKRFRATITIIILLAYLVSTINIITKILPIDKWQDVNNYISQHINTNKKQAFIYNFFIYKNTATRYYNNNLPTIPYYIGDEADYDEAIVKQNYLMYKREDSEMEQWYKKYEINKYDEIILMYHPYVGVDLPSLLKKNGWKLKEWPYKPRVSDEPELRYYFK